MKNGWIKLYRSIKEKGWYKKGDYLHLWLHILLLANHSKKEFWFNGKSISVNAGQFITGRKKLNSETGISESKIERILTYFEKIEQQITQQKTNRNRLITVLKWDEYQEIEQQSRQPVDNQWTTSGQPVDTNKNDKNDKNEKKEIYSAEISEILEYLNLKADKKYKSGTEMNRKPIGARLHEGHTVQDCKRVIDIKCSQWKGDQKMDGFLRPSTLFRPSKFQGYLSEKVYAAPRSNKVPPGISDLENEFRYQPEETYIEGETFEQWKVRMGKKE